MLKLWHNVFALFSGAILAVLFFASASISPAASDKTLDNLMTAYNGESNAHARYLAFAKKADSEGYGQVASLFRAAARAEELHANNHAEVIIKMGGTPKADVKIPDVKSTAENLQAAIQGESYERDTMYPEFIAHARTERNRDAIRSFNYALSAETEHAKLYAAGLNQLASLKGSQPAVYYVCTICGYTVKQVNFSKCPSCFNPVDKYVKVS
jgi:rubrerythrin